MNVLSVFTWGSGALQPFLIKVIEQWTLRIAVLNHEQIMIIVFFFPLASQGFHKVIYIELTIVLPLNRGSVFRSGCGVHSIANVYGQFTAACPFNRKCPCYSELYTENTFNYFLRDHVMSPLQSKRAQDYPTVKSLIVWPFKQHTFIKSSTMQMLFKYNWNYVKWKQ